MHTLYYFSVLLHILAAIAWIGGMFFLMLVVVPWLRTGDRAKAAELMRATGTRFRTVGWACFAIVLVTGSFNLWVRGVRLSSFTDPAWLGSAFGTAVVLKLGVFCVVLVISAVHDFVHGPAATAIALRDPRSPEAERYRKRAALLGRVNALLAIVLVMLAVAIVRGFPW